MVEIVDVLGAVVVLVLVLVLVDGTVDVELRGAEVVEDVDGCAVLVVGALVDCAVVEFVWPCSFWLPLYAK